MKGAASLSSTLLARKGSAAPLGGASVAPLWAQARPQAPANGAAAGERELPRAPVRSSSKGPRRTFRKAPDEATVQPDSDSAGSHTGDAISISPADAPSDAVVANAVDTSEAASSPIVAAAGDTAPQAYVSETAAAREVPSTCAIADATGEPCVPGLEMDKTVKVSLRLDPERHLRLRLASAHLRRSAQKILMSALESYLDTTVGTPANATCACFKYRSGDQSTSN